MVDKKLFLYNLAVVAIFKDEGKYLKEWLDYHLLAGVEHFYLYNNDSSDDYQEVLAPYVKSNVVKLINFPGKTMQLPAYNDAIEKFRFECRYMAFIDLDEFIFPKTNQSIAEVVDEILSKDENVAALGIQYQCFGSNGQETADYSRGVLERFTRRAPIDWFFINEKNIVCGNPYVKSIANPRLADYFISPHLAFYFNGCKSINTNGKEIKGIVNQLCADKIVLNHYIIKSKAEYYKKKMRRGYACSEENPYDKKYFEMHDRNEVFDDGILSYRATRADCFAPESEAQRISRVKNALVDTLTQDLSSNALETFLTCRSLAEKLGDNMAEEYSLIQIHKILDTENSMTYADLQLLIRALPEILPRPFKIVKNIIRILSLKFLPIMIEVNKNEMNWKEVKDLHYLQRLLNSI